MARPSLTVTEALRQHAVNALCAYPYTPLSSDIDELKKTEWSLEFEEHRLRRMILGFLRYGYVAESRNDNIASLINEANLFQTTGNAEHLLNIANYAMIAWMQRRHPNWHFRAQDDEHHAVQGEPHGD